MTDKRMKVVLGLMPADAVFIVRRGYVVDEDSNHPLHVNPLLWRPNRANYVSEYNPWQAGVYTLDAAGYGLKNEVPDDTHSYVVRVSEYIGARAIQDDTPISLLIDEIIRLRELFEEADNAALERMERRG